MSKLVVSSIYTNSIVIYSTIRLYCWCKAITLILILTLITNIQMHISYGLTIPHADFIIFICLSMHYWIYSGSEKLCNTASDIKILVPRLKILVQWTRNNGLFKEYCSPLLKKIRHVCDLLNCTKNLHCHYNYSQYFQLL